MLRDTMMDGATVREGDRVIATQEEAEFLLQRGYARAEPIKPRRSKKGSLVMWIKSKKLLINCCWILVAIVLSPTLIAQTGGCKVPNEKPPGLKKPPPPPPPPPRR